MICRVRPFWNSPDIRRGKGSGSPGLLSSTSGNPMEMGQLKLVLHLRLMIIRRLEVILVRGGLGLDSSWERLGHLSCDEKVAVALDMSDACLRVCAEGIKTQCPGIVEGELVEKLRARLEWSKRQRRR